MAFITKDNIKTIGKQSEKSVIPADEDELTDIILQRINDEGPDCDLNDIDLRNIKDMTELFSAYNKRRLNGKPLGCGDFRGDISDWDVSGVENMDSMFNANKKFNGDISQWDVSNVRNMSHMFCESNFHGDIRDWNTESLVYMSGIFNSCPFNGNISKWNVENVRMMNRAFYQSSFSSNLNNWKPINLRSARAVFDNSPLHHNPPKWYIEFLNR